jgi:hypothetical protein
MRAGTLDGLKSPANVTVPVLRRTYRGACVPITTASHVHTGDSTCVHEDTHHDPTSLRSVVTSPVYTLQSEVAGFNILWTTWLDSTGTSKPAGGAAGAKSIRGLEKKAQGDVGYARPFHGCSPGIIFRRWVRIM